MSELLYQVNAYNTATASTNKIHDDAVARRLGFRGGLVPGVDVYAYLCHLPAAHWGRRWLAAGTMRARFEAPVYDGDALEVTATLDGDDLDLVLRNSSGAVCARGRAAVSATPAALPEVGVWPSGVPPEDPPPAAPDTLVAHPFGSLAATFVGGRAGEYLDDIRETLPLFRAQRLAHPGWLLRFANYALSANVRLGPWIHVESDVRFFGLVGDGDLVETRSVVTGVDERGGHRFVDLDVLQVVGERAVVRTGHRAIYRPRGVADATT